MGQALFLCVLPACIAEGDDLYATDRGVVAVDGATRDLAQPPAYADVAPIIKEKCGQCHGEPLLLGAPNVLTTLEGARLSSSRIAARVQLGTMPPPGQGYRPVTEAEAALLLAWSTAGGPE